VWAIKHPDEVKKFFNSIGDLFKKKEGGGGSTPSIGGTSGSSGVFAPASAAGVGNANKAPGSAVQSAGQPRLVGQITDGIGQVYGEVDVVNFVGRNGGASITLGVRDLGIGADELAFVQTVNTTQPGYWPDGVTPRSNPLVDGDPFYYTRAELPSFTNVKGYSLFFQDNPHREPKLQPVQWNAELSVVGRFPGSPHYQRLITIGWGFVIRRQNGPVEIVGPAVIEDPTDFHTKAIP
jgi:hypothetical protein